MKDRLISGLSNAAKTVDRHKTFILKGNSEESENVDGLLSPGRIEELVREGRPPLKLGSIGSRPVSSKKPTLMQPYYCVPPVGFHPDDIKEVYLSLGEPVFVNKLGIKRNGSMYTLTDEQANEVEERIAVERARLGGFTPDG
jgi:hypothetical protein